MMKSVRLRADEVFDPWVEMHALEDLPEGMTANPQSIYATRVDSYTNELQRVGSGCAVLKEGPQIVLLENRAVELESARGRFNRDCGEPGVRSLFEFEWEFRMAPR